jgi:hypothetical protein
MDQLWREFWAKPSVQRAQSQFHESVDRSKGQVSGMWKRQEGLRGMIADVQAKWTSFRAFTRRKYRQYAAEAAIPKKLSPTPFQLGTPIPLTYRVGIQYGRLPNRRYMQRL